MACCHLTAGIRAFKNGGVRDTMAKRHFDFGFDHARSGGMIPTLSSKGRGFNRSEQISKLPFPP